MIIAISSVHRYFCSNLLFLQIRIYTCVDHPNKASCLVIFEDLYTAGNVNFRHLRSKGTPQQAGQLEGRAVKSSEYPYQP